MLDLTLARPADVVPRNGGGFNAAACGADDHERRAILLVACVAGLSVMSAAMLLFVDDASVSWLDSNSELAIGALRCDAKANGRRRYECPRDDAQAAARLASSATALARH